MSWKAEELRTVFAMRSQNDESFLLDFLRAVFKVLAMAAPVASISVDEVASGAYTPPMLKEQE